MKTSTHFLFSFFLASSFVFAQAIAKDELPKGNETGNRIDPSESLVQMISEGNVFQIEKEQMECPSVIQLKKTDGRSFANPDKVEKDDIFFGLDGYREEQGRITFDNFVHENNYFHFKTKLKGKSKNLGDGCSILLGIACRSEYQITNKDSVEFQGSARILSVAMVATSSSSVQFNPEKNTITYNFKGNGIPDLVCSYKAASPELKNKISAYHAENEAAMLAREQSLKVDNTNRSAVKETEQRSPAGESSATKTQSK